MSKLKTLKEIAANKMVLKDGAECGLAFVKIDQKDFGRTFSVGDIEDNTFVSINDLRAEAIKWRKTTRICPADWDEFFGITVEDLK